jgi:hypothetical protein
MDAPVGHHRGDPDDPADPAAGGVAAATGSGATAPAKSTASPRKLTGIRAGFTLNLLI